MSTNGKTIREPSRARADEGPLRYAAVSSPIGTLVLSGDDLTLHGVRMGTPSKSPARSTMSARTPADAARPLTDVGEPHPLRAAARQLDEYFRGERTDFELPIALRGTAFQIAVWQALREVPYAETVSYGDIARRIGRPTGFRAVGMAIGRNPLAVVVPCHRVIGADGSLTGFGGGLVRKRLLLDHEAQVAGRNMRAGLAASP